MGHAHRRRTSARWDRGDSFNIAAYGKKAFSEEKVEFLQHYQRIVAFQLLDVVNIDLLELCACVAGLDLVRDTDFLTNKSGVADSFESSPSINILYIYEMFN